MPGLDNTTFQDPIALDASEEVVDLFLLLFKDRKTLPLIIDEQSLLDLYRLCDLWRCSTSFFVHVRKAFARADVDPWRVLIYANTIPLDGDVELAQIAIAKFSPTHDADSSGSSDSKGNFTFDFSKRLSQLQPPWQRALTYAVFGTEDILTSAVAQMEIVARPDWTQNAADFDPSEWQTPE